MNCKNCLASFDPKPSHKKFCCHACYMKWYNNLKFREPPYTTVLPTATVGALGELVVASDLLKRGFHVFRSLSPACPCDLAILAEQSVLVRIEVRTVRRHRSGKLHLSRNNIKADVLAKVVFGEGIIEYESRTDAGILLSGISGKFA